jgi:hypothetical protein
MGYLVTLAVSPAVATVRGVQPRIQRSALASALYGYNNEQDEPLGVAAQVEIEKQMVVI